jgi:hypothetical protein
LNLPNRKCSTKVAAHLGNPTGNHFLPSSLVIPSFVPVTFCHPRVRMGGLLDGLTWTSLSKPSPRNPVRHGLTGGVSGNRAVLAPPPDWKAPREASQRRQELRKWIPIRPIFPDGGPHFPGLRVGESARLGWVSSVAEPGEVFEFYPNSPLRKPRADRLHKLESQGRRWWKNHSTAQWIPFLKMMTMWVNPGVLQDLQGTNSLAEIGRQLGRSLTSTDELVSGRMRWLRLRGRSGCLVGK